MRTRLALILPLAAALAFAAAGCGGNGKTAPTVATTSTGTIAGFSCDPGYRAAALPWGNKCLVHGQYCRGGQDEAYAAYGFRCTVDRRLD